MTTTAQKNAKAGGATGKNRSSMVVVHLRARPPRCKKDERGEGCVLVTSEGPRGSVLVKCRDRRMPSSGGGGGGREGRGRQQQQQQQQQQQHASFQFTGNVLREATNDEVFEAVAKEAVEAATDGSSSSCSSTKTRRFWHRSKKKMFPMVRMKIAREFEKRSEND